MKKIIFSLVFFFTFVTVKASNGSLELISKSTSTEMKSIYLVRLNNTQSLPLLGCPTHPYTCRCGVTGTITNCHGRPLEDMLQSVKEVCDKACEPKPTSDGGI
jgi:hypothetical protein